MPNKGEHTQWYHPNMEKYLKQPSPEFMREVIQKAGVSARQFGRYYGIPTSIVRQCVHAKSCFRKPLPAKYWHLFFEQNPIPLREKIPYYKKRKSLKAKRDNAISSLL